MRNQDELLKRLGEGNEIIKSLRNSSSTLEDYNQEY